MTSATLVCQSEETTRQWGQSIYLCVYTSKFQQCFYRLRWCGQGTLFGKATIVSLNVNKCVCTVNVFKQNVWLCVFINSVMSPRVTQCCSVAKAVERGINTVMVGDFICSRTTHVTNAPVARDQSIHQGTSGGPGMYNKIIKHVMRGEHLMFNIM